jgi:UDP-N-acetylmuramyl pentapeptide phosphotransferase/UDP-N-acetylglucosamine-1-phosphate transferase
LALIALIALAIAWASILLSTPWLERHAVVHPNARSAHHRPTPQGAGLAVVAATLVVAWAAIFFAPGIGASETGPFAAATVGAILLLVLGGIDDLRALPATPRLIAQTVCAAILVAALPAQWHILPFIPWWLERLLLVAGCVWLVNLVNFMDGMDWMMVAETVPVTGAISALGLIGAVDIPSMIAAAALFGAMLGFAPFNKPVAKLFLGDVGSLPVGFVLGFLLINLAGHGHLAAALILPGYYIADATITLFSRIIRREPIWQAHRNHFYQRAAAKGFSVREIVGRIFAVNLALVALALISVAANNVILAAVCVVAACAIIAWLLLTLARGRL